jgi:RecB family exonuclease
LDEVYLEGEIDGLAYNDFSHALIIDYKTGGSTHDAPDYLLAKHRLQATCYAYALLKAGFESVDAHFLRIEHVSEANPRNPVIVPYHFEAKDKQVLEAYLLAAYKEARHES